MIRKTFALLGIFLFTACIAQSPDTGDWNTEPSSMQESLDAVGIATIAEFSEASLARAVDVAQSEVPTADIANPISNAVCPPDGRVAFSVTGSGHVSQGGALLLGYNDKIYTNVGGGWPNTLNGSTFTAPCSGLYAFDLGFVRDSAYYGGSNDDVSVTIYKNGVPMGSGWAGESAPSRMTGTYSVTMMLNANDTVYTMVSSDAGSRRHVASFYFSGFFIR